MTKKITAIGALFIACSAFGAGFQVLEQGTSNIGTALAGATVNASSDASSAFWNPSASMFSGMKVGELKADVGLTFVIPTMEFHNTNSTPGPSTNTGGNAGEVAYVPNFFAVYRFSEDVAFTLSTTGTFGLETDYDMNWIGAYHAINSAITNMEVTPAIVYKPVEWLSISGGLSVNWMHAKLTQQVPGALVELTGSSWGVGGNVGITAEYMEGGRIGFTWRSQVEHSVNGNGHMNGNIYSPIQAEVTLPQSFNFGIYQKLSGAMERFAVMADYSYTCWSSFKTLYVKGSGGAPVNENWKNVSRVAFGVTYNPEFDDNLILRLGTAWDESPIRSAEFRTARIPDTDRIWLSCGAGYTYENIQVNLAYSYIWFYNNADIRNTSAAGTLEGYYTGEAHLVSIQATIRW